MEKNEKKLSRSRALAAKVTFAALEVLRDNGNEMPMRDLMTQVENKVELDEWDTERYEKSGYIRWQSILHFYSIDCIKAGFLLKKKGTWYLTPEGEEAIALGEIKLLEVVTKAYRKWKAEQEENAVEDELDEDDATAMAFEEIEQVAMEGLEKYIQKKNAYEFQDIVAALLRAMGYYTPFIAPKGKDGGIDIIAYQDPLGTESPRIQVQVKHREKTAANVQEIRQLMGLIHKEGDVGIFVSSGGFTSDAKMTARTSHVHIELIDLARFISMWQEFYEKLTDEDKTLLPLTPIYCLAVKE